MLKLVYSSDNGESNANINQYNKIPIYIYILNFIISVTDVEYLLFCLLKPVNKTMGNEVMVSQVV